MVSDKNGKLMKYYVFTAFVLLTLSLWAFVEHLLSNQCDNAAGYVAVVATIVTICTICYGFKSTDKTYS